MSPQSLASGAPCDDDYRAFGRHVNPSLSRFLEMSGRAHKFVRAEACALIDDAGVRWDDWISGFGALPLGHHPPAIHDAIRAHLDRAAPSMLVESVNPFAGALAARLVALAGEAFETAFLCNSGAEAIEAALKTAMLATSRTVIAYADGGYHGTTLGALACMGRGLYRDPFADVVDRLGFREVPFDDLSALERTLQSGDVAAFVVEPIQMEAGVRIASSDYLHGLKALCRKHGTLLVLDEVQTGLARTGEVFAFQRHQVAPDILVLAKALGAGVVPVGAAVMAEGVWRAAFGSYLRSEIHNSTMGGNALSCVVASKVLDVISDPAFVASVRARGDALFSRIRSALSGRACVERISSCGLLGGVKLRVEHPWLDWESLGLPELSAFPTGGPLVVERLARRHVLAQVCAHDWSVVRIEPPLVVDQATCDRFVDALSDAVSWLDQQ